MVDKKESLSQISASRGAYDYSKRYLGNIADDYVMVTNKKEHKDCIGIKGGKYDGVIYKYGKVAAVEDANNNTLPATLKFNYNIIDRNGLPEDDPNYFNKDFKNLLGDILCDIVDQYYSREEIFSGKQSDDRKDNTKSTNT